MVLLSRWLTLTDGMLALHVGRRPPFLAVGEVHRAALVLSCNVICLSPKQEIQPRAKQGHCLSWSGPNSQAISATFHLLYERSRSWKPHWEEATTDTAPMSLSWGPWSFFQLRITYFQELNLPVSKYWMTQYNSKFLNFRLPIFKA